MEYHVCSKLYDMLKHYSFIPKDTQPSRLHENRFPSSRQVQLRLPVDIVERNDQKPIWTSPDLVLSSDGDPDKNKRVDMYWLNFIWLAGCVTNNNNNIALYHKHREIFVVNGLRCGARRQTDLDTGCLCVGTFKK